MKDKENGMDKKALRYLGNCYFQQNRIRNYFAIIAVSLTSILFTGGFTIVIGIVSSYVRFQMAQNKYNSGDFYNNIIAFAPAVLIFLFLVMAVGYVTIYNIFSISILQDIKFYGLLGTINAEPKHIRYFIRLQADKIAFFAIPIGTVTGFLVGNLLIPTILDALNQNFNNNWEFKISFHPFLFLFSILFSYITLRLSCNRSGKIAVSFSSIEAVRYQEYTDKWKKTKRNKKGYHYEKWEKKGEKEHIDYHICFFTALKNIYRNPKKTFIMTISLSLGMILFMVSITLLRSINLEKYIGDSLGNIDFFLTSENHNNGNSLECSDLHATIRDAELFLKNSFVESQVSEIGYSRMHLTFQNKEKKGILDTKKAQNYLLSNQLLYEDGQGDFVEMIPFFVMGMDAEILQEVQVIEGTFKKEPYDRGNYIVIEEDNEIGITRNVYHVGDKVTVCEKQYEVMAVVRVPQYLSRMSKVLNELLFIFPEREARQVIQYIAKNYNMEIEDEEVGKKEIDKKYITYFDNYKVYGGVYYTRNGQKEKLEQALEHYVKDKEGLVYYSKKKLTKELQSAYKMFFFILGALCILVGTIASVNSINFIIVGIFSRKKLFTMLKNIGMEQKQQMKMLLWEGTFYMAAMLIITLIFGSGLSYFVLRNRCMQSNFMVYQYSIFPVIFLTGILLAIICFISKKVYKRMKIYES